MSMSLFFLTEACFHTFTGSAMESVQSEMFSTFSMHLCSNFSASI